MLQGRVGEFDAVRRVGLIDGDDGRVFLFNAYSLDPPVPECIDVGVPVAFAELDTPLGPRALHVSVIGSAWRTAEVR